MAIDTEDIERIAKVAADEVLEGRSVSEGIFDLGYAAGSLRRVVEKYKMKTLLGKPISAEDRADIAKAACDSTEISAAIWHRPHPEAALLLEMLVRNQVYGRPADSFCAFAVDASKDDRLLPILVDAIEEIGDMLLEPCGQSHIESIIGCLVAKREEACESLEGWKKTREDVMRQHHKARIPSAELDAVLAED